MKKIILLVGLIPLSFCVASYASPLIDNSNITVTGTVQPGYSTSSTIDDNLNTFWHGVNDLVIGQVDYLSYKFNNFYSISQIDFYDDYTNHYQMGELDIQTSLNSTDGINGTWSTIAHKDGDYNPPNGDWTLSTNTGYLQWVRLYMTYQGRGAHGGSPAFYLSEIDFYGTPIPEPSSMLLLGFGLLGAGFLRRKR